MMSVNGTHWLRVVMVIGFALLHLEMAEAERLRWFM
jgi:hypothetical protein